MAANTAVAKGGVGNATAGMANAAERSSAGPVIAVPGSRRAASFMFLSPSRFTRSAPFGPVQRDSVLFQVSRAVPLLARTRRVTQEEKDSLLRLEAGRQAMWRDQGRPMPISDAWSTRTASWKPSTRDALFSLFSPGPSRQKRMRDSVVHHDNMQRLKRLDERVSAKRDSIRRADSLAALANVGLP